MTKVTTILVNDEVISHQQADRFDQLLLTETQILAHVLVEQQRRLNRTIERLEAVEGVVQP